ncbi:MAG: hypothetical protein JXJ17_06115 [Anaerolineae bacterium]|nr:hypothetical protein [Anaerolineae bacterium]
MITRVGREQRIWASQPTSFEEIPEVFYPAFSALAAHEDPFPTTIILPTGGVYGKPEIPWIFTCLTDAIAVLALDGSEVDVTLHRIDSINTIEVTINLLYSKVEIHSIDEAGAPVSTMFEYNTVFIDFFTPFIQVMRQGFRSSTPPIPSELARFDVLKSDYYKFMNYSRRCLLADQTVSSFVMQPTISEPLLVGWNKLFYKTVVPAHISILTNSEYIDIHEEVKPWWYFGAKYGKTYRYVHRSRIRSVQVNDQDDELIALSLDLPGDEQIDVTFDTDRRQDVEQLLTEFETSLN